MRNEKLILYPLLIVILIFALDKLALIPSIRDYGRPDMTPMENMQTNLATIAKTNSNPDVLVFGTSRSDIFKFIHPSELPTAPAINSKDKKLLLSTYIETRGVIRASELFVTYAMLRSIIDDGMRPEAVLVEVSPEMFNKNSSFNIYRQIIDQIYPVRYMIELLWFTKGKPFKEALNRTLFASYAYRFRPERAISRIITGKKVSRNNMAVFLLGQVPVTETLPNGYRDYEPGNIPPDVFQERFIGYLNTLKENGTMMNFEYDPAELEILHRIINVAKENKIKLILWRPPLHPVYNAAIGNTVYREHESGILKVMKDSGFPVINGEKLKMECNRFVDASHVSGRCAPWLMAHIIRSACADGIKELCKE